MIKIVSTALFAFYTLSSGNRLLQQAPQFIAAGPAVGTPAVEAPGQSVSVPAPAPAPVATVPAPAAFIPITLPNAGGPQLELNCCAPYTEPGTCAGQLQEFTNPARHMKVACCGLGACAQTNMVFNIQNCGGERINDMIFGEDYSGYMANILVDNRSPCAYSIDNMECKGAASCQDMKIKLIDASLNDMSCQKASGACVGCTVEVCKREMQFIQSSGVMEEVIACEAPKACGFW